MPTLKAVGRLHAGTDNTDLEACRERGIKVIHASSANVRSNAEYLLSSLLLLYRRGVVSALMGRRHPTTQMGRELHGSTGHPRAGPDRAHAGRHAHRPGRAPDRV